MVLKNPPLIDIGLTIWWHVSTQEKLIYTEFLKSDFYAEIFDSFPNRTLQGPSNENYGPTFIYSRDTDKVKITLTNSSLHISTNEENYNWKQFTESINEFVKTFIAKLTAISLDHIHIELYYVDFIEKAMDDGSSRLAFLKNKLNTDVNCGYCESEKLRNISLSFRYDTDYGQKHLEIGEGSFKEKKGILIKTTTTSNHIPLDFKAYSEWADIAHADCVKTFKEITKGDLYDSFSS